MVTESLETGSQKRFSDLLLESGYVTQDHLAYARRVQAKLEHDLPLGEVLVRLKYISRSQLNELLQEDKRRIRIGDLLVELGVLSPSELQAALTTQAQRADMPLGKILVEMGLLSERQLLKSLSDQKDIPFLEPIYEMLDPPVVARVPLRFLRTHCMVPVRMDRDGVLILLVNQFPSPERVQMIEEHFKCGIRFAVAAEDAILGLLDRYEAESADGTASAAQTDEEHIVRVVEFFIREAIEKNASDIHFEPMAGCLRVRYRIDGVLIHRTDLPKDMQKKILSRVKILAGADIAEQRLHQDGRFKYEVEGQTIDMRMSSYVTVHGENVVLRLLNRHLGLIPLDELGMSPRMLTDYMDHVLQPPSGVVIAAGPTGSGKTTTLYSSLDFCNDIGVKIITAEDPVEYQIDGMMQCSINPKIGLTYEDTLRAIVRQDPDIIVLGEIRDLASAETAMNAALTGHKVYTTLHAEDSTGALLRLLNMGIEAHLIASTITAIVAQRLLRRVCNACCVADEPNPRHLYLLGLNRHDLRPFRLLRGRGCTQCHYTGYSGRTGIFELLRLAPGIKDAIMQQPDFHAIRTLSAKEYGLVTMQESGIAKVLQGLTTFDEVLANAPVLAEPRSFEEIFDLLGEDLPAGPS